MNEVALLSEARRKRHRQMRAGRYRKIKTAFVAVHVALALICWTIFFVWMLK